MCPKDERVLDIAEWPLGIELKANGELERVLARGLQVVKDEEGEYTCFPSESRREGIDTESG